MVVRLEGKNKVILPYCSSQAGNKGIGAAWIELDCLSRFKGEGCSMAKTDPGVQRKGRRLDVAFSCAVG